MSKTLDFILKILLFFIFFLIITPIGLLLRRAGKDYLSKNNKKTNTFWITRNSALPIQKKVKF